MSKPKKGSEEVTRDALEGYIWKATGWRGSPEVIEAILRCVDQYTDLQVRRASAELVLTHRKELEAAADRAAQEVTAAVQRAEKVVPVERTTVDQLLKLLGEAFADASATLSMSTKTVNAVDALIRHLRAADGKVKDVVLIGQIAERRADPEFATRLAKSMEQNSAALERLAADAEAFPGEDDAALALELREVPAADLVRDLPHAKLEIVTDGDAQVARVLGAREQEIDAGLGRRVDEAVEAGERRRQRARKASRRESVLPDIAEFSEPESATAVPSETFDQMMQETPPEPNEATREAFQRLDHPDIILEPDEAVLKPEPEIDPIMAMVAEAEAEMLADGTGKRCSACEHVKARTEFYRDKSAPDGLMYTCKGCCADRARVRDAAIAAKRAAAAQAQD